MGECISTNLFLLNDLMPFHLFSLAGLHDWQDEAEREYDASPETGSPLPRKVQAIENAMQGIVLLFGATSKMMDTAK